jgi:hypothetical protein
MFRDRLEVRPAVLSAANPVYTRESNLNPQLKQLRILSLGLPQDRDVWVGVFPQREEVFVCGECPDAGGIGIRALRGFQLQGFGTSQSEMRYRSCPAIPYNAAVVDNLLKLGGGSALSVCQVCLTAYVSRIKT